MATKCLSCTSNYTFLSQSNYCKLICPAGEAWLETNECKPCGEYCAQCSEISFTCNVCKEGYRHSLVDIKRCVKIYPEFLEITKTQLDSRKHTLSIEFRFEIQDFISSADRLRIAIKNSDGSAPAFKVRNISKKGPRLIVVEFDFESSLIDAEITITDKNDVI